MSIGVIERSTEQNGILLKMLSTLQINQMPDELDDEHLKGMVDHTFSHKLDRQNAYDDVIQHVVLSSSSLELESDH